MRQALIIFAKNPVKGQVKTRLAKKIGDEEALEVYHRLLEHTRLITQPLDCDKYLFYSHRVEEKDDWPDTDFYKRVQQGTNLGARMLNAFSQMFEQKYDSVVIIGTDCPELSTTTLQQAFKELKNNDFVIGPAEDGGYYLLGMNQLTKNIFKNKSWSTSSVCIETIKDIKHVSGDYSLLPTLSDLDHAEDLEKLKFKQ